MIQLQTENVRRVMIDHEGDAFEVKLAVVNDSQCVPHDEVTLTLRVKGEVLTKLIRIQKREEREVLEELFRQATEIFQG